MAYQPDPTRYQRMRYRRSGESGLRLPAISLGLWHNFGARSDANLRKRMCFTAFDCGVTHFDLADNYGPERGSAEENFGRIVRQELRAYRDELLISTKAGYPMWDGPYGDWGGRKHMLAGLDQSLQRLGLPYVDIFYHHRMDPETPLWETMCALDTAVKSGRALYAGLSRYDGAHLAEAIAMLSDLRCPFVLCQDRYSIFDRVVEQNGALEKITAAEKGLIVFSPLAQGLLTNRYLSGVPADSRIRTDGRYLRESALTPERLDQIRALNALAEARGQTLAQMAISWLLQKDCVTSVLIGASRPEQISENAGALDGPAFTPEELQRIDAIAQNSGAPESRA